MGMVMCSPMELDRQLLIDRRFDHVARAIDSGELRSEPWPHFVADDVLPPDMFERLVADLPAFDSMMKMSQFGPRSISQYENHATQLFSEVTDRACPQVWRDLDRMLGSDAFQDRVLEAVAPEISPLERSHPIDREVRLDCGRAGAFLLPHTDAPIVLMKALIYLAPAEVDRTGDTLLYTPRDYERRLRKFADDGDFTTEQYAHESEEDHVRSGVVRFKPNRMFGFYRTRDSVHGLDHLTAKSAPRYIIAVHYKFQGGRPRV